MRLAQLDELAAPLVAVLEVSGAVLTWIIDDPAGAAAVQIAFTDPARADWLWRVVGESGHAAVVTAASELQPSRDGTDLAGVDGVDIVPGSIGPLHRLALGHWLRRWWPASQRDGIAGLDRALLDVELAVLTAAAQDYFTDDTLDSDVAGLLDPHAPALHLHAWSEDARIRNLVRAGAELADELGVDAPGWAELSAAVQDSGTAALAPTGHQDDYALAAGADTGPRAAAHIGRGVASINWGAVPPGVFDAAEDTVAWNVEAAGPSVIAVVRAAVIGPEPATDIPVRVRSGSISGDGALDAGGQATVPLLDAQRRALTEPAAWNHDWPATSVAVGADITEPREARERIRRWVRARLEEPPPGAFLAEILAAESVY